MPTQFKKKVRETDSCSAIGIKDYYDTMLSMLKLAIGWDDEDADLQEFLDSDGPLTEEPPEFKEFRFASVNVYKMGKNIGVIRGNNLNDVQLRALARHLYGEKNWPRLRYYTQSVRSRLRKGKDYPTLVSLVELEYRFQHYLYRKRRHYQGLGLGPKFSVWITENNCHTFYDECS